MQPRRIEGGSAQVLLDDAFFDASQWLAELTERYRSHANYTAAVTQAASALAVQLLLLPVDVQAYITAAQ